MVYHAQNIIYYKHNKFVHHLDFRTRQNNWVCDENCSIHSISWPIFTSLPVYLFLRMQASFPLLLEVSNQVFDEYLSGQLYPLASSGSSLPKIRNGSFHIDSPNSQGTDSF